MRNDLTVSPALGSFGLNRWALLYSHENIMAKRKLMSQIALESDFIDEDGGQHAVINPSAVLAPSDDLPTIVLDQDQTLREVATIEKKLDDTLIIRDTLSNAQEIIQSSTDSGGLKAASAELLTVIDKSTGEVATQADTTRTLPAAENFQYIRERELNTRVALEAITERLNSVWQWFVEKVKALLHHIKNFYDRSTLYIELLERRLNKVEHRLNSLNTSSPIREVENAALLASLNVSGRFPLDLLGEVRSFLDVAHSIFAWRAASEITRITDDFKKYINGGSFEPLATAFTEAPIGFKRSTSSEDGHLQQYASPLLLGSRQVVVTLMKEGDTKEEFFQDNLTKLGFRIESEEHSFDGKNTIKVLSLSELKKLVGEVRLLLTTVKQHKEALGSIQRVYDELTRFASTQMNQLVDDHSDRQRLVSEFVLMFPKLLNQPSLQYNNYLLNTTRALIGYIDFCVKEPVAAHA